MSSQKIVGQTYWSGWNIGSRGKTGQRRIDLLNLFETFGRELGSVGKASIGRAGSTTGKKGDNGGRAIGKFRSIKGLTTDLLVIIINTVEPKGGSVNALEWLEQRQQRQWQ